MKAWGVPEEEWDSASAIVDPEAKGPRIYFQRMGTPKQREWEEGNEYWVVLQDPEGNEFCVQ